MRTFLYLLQLQFLFPLVRLIEDNDIFILTNNNWCITNSSSAITFKSNIGKTNDGYYGSNLFPKQDNIFDCNFEENEICSEKSQLWTTGNWYIQNSLYSEILAEPIIDERWENFPIIKTDGDLFVEKLQYKEVLTIRKNNEVNFVIPLSIRIKKEAHIYLCDGETPVYSNCYWIMLGMNDGKQSKIRKCKSGQISYNHRIYPSDPDCKNGLVEKNINPLDEDEWKHFLIKIRDGHLDVYYNNQIFLEVNDSVAPYYIKKMFVHSKKADGLWKLHIYNFLESRAKTIYTPAPLGRNIFGETEICISMFMKTSQGSTLTVKIKPTGEDFISEVIETGESWKKVKIYREIKNVQLKNKYYYLYITRKGDNGYWAIDDIRQCKKEEFRYITSTDDDECHLLSIDKPRIINMKNKKKEISTTGIDCPENSFSTSCISCKIFGRDYCRSIKYCQAADKCYCSAGYTNIYCNTECPRGTYGHGCQKESYCSERNDPVSGLCYSCVYPFEGPTCNTTSMPFFLNDPVVVGINYTTFSIQQVDLRYAGSDGSFYKFQYLDNEDGSNTWVTTVDGKIPINMSKIVTVTGVKPDTNYSVRAIIFRRQSRANQFSKKNITFTTNCQKLSKDDVVIDSFNTSATVKFKLPLHSCNLSKYVYCLKDCVQFSGNVLEFSMLKPHTEYTLKIFRLKENELTKTFTTTDGIPSSVININKISFARSLKISWEKPKTENGEIVGYEIGYKLFKQIFCLSEESNTYLYQNTTDTHITLENLLPYSRYEISIRAITRAFKGNFASFYQDTKPSEEISPNEKISITEIFVNGRVPRISWNKIPCSIRTGPIYIKSETVCISDWCGQLNETKVDNFEYETDEKTVYQELQPYCNYTITLSISRNEINWLFSDSKTFTSSPSRPDTVTHLSVFSKNKTSISLRWMPPYPPKGVLKEYQIEIKYKRNYWHYTERILKVPKTTCNLWKEFHCTTITEVSDGYVYYIKVSAKNQEPDEFGPFSEINVNKYQMGPEPPYNLKYEWTDENKLYITFFHPNNTNGVLKSFEIKVFGKSEYKRIDTEENYKLQYKINYNDLEFLVNQEPCSDFKIFIRAHNTYTSSKFVELLTYVPPSIPIGIRAFNYKSGNSTIAINLIFQTYPNRVIILVSKRINTDELRLFELNYLINQTLHTNLTSFWVVYENNNLNSSIVLEIGNENMTWHGLTNPPLESGTNYTILVYLVNYCKNYVTRWRKEEKVIPTKGQSMEPSNEENLINNVESDNGNNLWALLLLVLIPIVLFSVWYFKKKNLDLHRFMNRPSVTTPNGDELPLTDKKPLASPRVHVVKPKPAIVLPTLQTKHSKNIPIIEFESYVKSAIESGELDNQHKLFPKGLLKPHNVGSSAENKNKNRYKNLIAYDHTRVKLKKNNSDSDAEVGYINANYIDGYRKPRAFIATQGPKSNTLNDFWWMVWQENVKDILMLANIYENGKKKVDKYWPDINEEKSYGLIKVHFVCETVFANFVLRVFNCCYGNLKRKINQMHYTTWPDHGVPLYSQSLVPYLQRLLKIPHSTQAPILVHCSAGVGRTGTIILSDICLRMAAGEGHLDFLAHLENLRNQRSNLVDNIEQYKLAHLVVLECLFGMRTSILCNDDMKATVESTIRNNGVKTQLKYILETQWQDTAMEKMLENDEVAPIYHDKNRFKDIVPEKYRVYISRYPHTDEKSSYINAVLVDDFSSPGRYIVTQQPLPNTLGDFWRLVLERSCSVIISLNTINLTDTTVCKIWPESEEVLTPVDFITITHKYTKKLLFYEIVTVQLEVKKTKFSGFSESVTEVTIIALNTWNSKDLLPNSIEEFLAFKDASDVLARPAEHIIVTCYDGAKACGLYVALSFIMEQMKLEQECDVCLAVRSVRHSRKQFVETEEQYEFLYKAAVTFITGFQQYSNFT